MHRSCGEAALLVGGKRRLPADPVEYNREFTNGAGCNNLRCGACGATVRSGAPGMRLVGGRQPKDLPAMYATTDWTTLRYLKADHPAWRLYACKCICWEEGSEHLVINDGDSPGDPRMPWVCDGHAMPELPLTLGELAISELGTDWADVVQRVLGGTCPRRLERADEGPSRWLVWLRYYLDGLSITANLSRAVVKRIDEGDDQVVGTVLTYLRAFAADPGILEAALTHAESNLEAVLVGHKVPELTYYRPSLWDVMILAMRRRTDELRGRLVDVVREVMLLPAKDGDPVKDTLADWAYTGVYREDDFQWMAEHIVALDTAGPGRWVHIMELLLHAQREDDELGYLVAIGGVTLIQSGRVPPTEFRTWMARHGDSQNAWTWPLEAALSE
ncbi:MAG: hypothetical protein H0V89_04780 [Deltaproteobacteria bacterium]|nr:hypothetical protein [Deltaproteobacteria bacterium]